MGYGQWLIVCEGTKTEPNYFSGLLDYLYKKGGRDLSPIVDIRGVGLGTESLVKRVEDFFAIIETEYGKVRMPHSNIAVVFDKDVFGKGSFNHAIKLADLQEKEYQDIERYIKAWSNESFELWIYLHFHFTDSAMNRHEVGAKLTDIFHEGGILKGRRSYSGNIKSKATIFQDILNCGGSLSLALKNAERLSCVWKDDKKYADQNPRTEVWRLVKALAEDAGTNIDEL